jgi:hypothetical protein
VAIFGAIAGAVAAPLIGGLLGGSSPPNVNTSGTQQTQLPPWYTAYLQGALGTGEALASQPFPQYTGQRLANFNDTQQTAFNDINNVQGNWAPAVQSGLGATSAVPYIAQNAAGLANTYGGGATGAATGAAGLADAYGSSAYGAASQPVTSWTDPGVASSWLNPYMSNVVNAIAQQGVQNWNTNLMPAIESQFIASGNPNSSANAAALGVGAAQTQANITAAQAQALQSGYQQSVQEQQAAEAQRLQQMGLQANTGLGAAGTAISGGGLGIQSNLGAANTALGGGTLGTQAGLGSANAYGNLGQLTSGLGYTDINALLNAGNQQQNLEQLGYNTAYGNFQQQVQWPWQQLQNLNNIATGAQLPTSTTATGSAPLAGATYGPSPLAIGSAIYSGLGGSSGNNTPISNWFGGLFNGSTPSSTSGNNGYNYVYANPSSVGPPSSEAGGIIYADGGSVRFADGGLARATDPRRTILPVNRAAIFRGPLAGATYG